MNEQQRYYSEKAPLREIEDVSGRFIRERLGILKSGFREFYASRGYVEHPSVDISSGIDPSVRFIGSHISVLKPYIKNRDIPSSGYYIVQNCVRTRNVKDLFNEESFPKWGSYFPSLGVLSNFDRVNELTEEVYDFLTSHLNLSGRDMVSRVSSADSDLEKVSRRVFGEDGVELDTMPPSYYRHEIGMEGVFGRNFNIAIRSSDDEKYADVANIIVLKDEKGEIGVELALGASTTLKQVQGLNHVLDCHPIEGLDKVDEIAKRKIQDCILVATALYREGLRPGGSGNRRRLLRKYIRGLQYFVIKASISLDELGDLIARFEKSEFDDGIVSATEIVDDISQFEDYIKSNDPKTEEEEMIKYALIKFS